MCTICKKETGKWKEKFTASLCKSCAYKLKKEIKKEPKKDNKNICGSCGTSISSSKNKLCSACKRKPIEPSSYINSYTIQKDEEIECVICTSIHTQGYIMKVHIKGMLCNRCHILSENFFGNEKISNSVISDNDQYDNNNNRLCDILGCRIYGKNLNNDYNGFFCNQHFKIIRETRKIIKGNPNTYEEYNARLYEIAIRKNISIEHIIYADTLYKWLTNINNEESNYINNLFIYS